MSKRPNSRARIAACVILVFLTTLAAPFGWCFSKGASVDPTLRFLSDEPDISEAVAACKIEYALTSSEVNDVVFVGDSGGASAFDPIEFQRACGDTAYNLCSEAGLGPIGYLVTLRAYLNNHPRTKAAVLCVTPVTMERSQGSWGSDLQARFMKHYEPEIGTLSEWDQFLYFSRIGLDSRSHPYNPEVRDKPLKYFEAETYSTLQKRLAESRGFNRLTAHGGGTFKPGTDKAKPILDEWSKPIQIMAMLCQQRGVRLFIVFSPVRRDIESARTWRPLEAWCRGMIDSYPNVSVLTPIVLLYNERLMWDSLHANVDGARVFSRKIAEYFDGLKDRGVEKFMPVVAKDVQSVLSAR